MIHGGEKGGISIMILVKKTTGANELCLHESILLVSQFFSVIDYKFPCRTNFDVLSFEDLAACMTGS